VNCRWNEEKVFPSPPVFEVLEQHFVEARLHTDGERGEELTEFEQRIAHSIATPLYLVLDPTTQRALAGPLGGIATALGFHKFLTQARASAVGEEKVGRLDAR